jgi:glycosyltransferase involved in cell wall biosynthesis
MHVLLIHQLFGLPNQPSGSRHHELLKHVVACGHTVSVVTGDTNYYTGKVYGSVAPERLNGIRLLRQRSIAPMNRSFVSRIASFLGFMVTSVVTAVRQRDVDVIMGTSPPTFQAVAACVAALIRRKRFVLEIRDLWPDFPIEMGLLRNPVLIYLARRIERFLYGNAAHIIVNSPAYRHILLERGEHPDKVSLIPNGVDPEMFSNCDDRQSFREKYALGDAFLVVYAGALGVANDLPVLLKAAGLIKTNRAVRIAIVGDGKERVALERLASKLTSTNVTFTGAVPKSEMPSVLAAADCCVAILQNIPMFRTTYPNKVFDYMAAGKPIVLAIDGVIREVVEAAQCGTYVQPGSAEALANAIQSMFERRGDMTELGKRGREYVRTHFNRNDHAHAFLELLEGVAGVTHESKTATPQKSV